MAQPAAVSPPKPSAAAPTVLCHWLPCNMDYDGMAPVHQYFTPQTVQEEKNDTPQQIQAAQLRGRGLLSAIVHAADSSSMLEGALLKFTSGGQVQKQASFDEIREWHHEHSIAAVKREASHVNTARDWCQVARAV